MTAPHPSLAAGWAPSSPCGPACQPDDDGRAAPRLRVATRMAGLVVVLLGAIVGAPLLPAGPRTGWVRACSAAALRASGVRLRVTGALVVDGGALVVANHLSWLDVLAVGAVAPVRMLAKREVRDWPLIGGLAERTGALFVDRAGLRALPGTVADAAAALRAGAVIAVFPEGTTWCGAAGGPFRRAAFQAAIDAGAPVVPVALVLRLADGTPTAAAAFVGDTTLWSSLLRVLRLPSLECALTVLPPIAPRPGMDRRELAGLAAAAVTAVTGVPHAVTGARADDGAAPAVAA
jgi:1-acyl-sn-glycerol-3-phosphate acyltransferase